MLLTRESDFKEYFLKELNQISPCLSLNLKNYLLELLCSYLHSDQLFDKKEGEDKFYEKSLLDWYEKSQHSKSQERLFIFKKIGDFSLYLSGFFRPSFKKKLVHISYYEQMGQNAYQVISSAYGKEPNVFEELALEFKNLSEILFSIQKKSNKKDSKYLLNFANQSPSDIFNQENH